MEQRPEKEQQGRGGKLGQQSAGCAWEGALGCPLQKRTGAVGAEGRRVSQGHAVFWGAVACRISAAREDLPHLRSHRAPRRVSSQRVQGPGVFTGWLLCPQGQYMWTGLLGYEVSWAMAGVALRLSQWMSLLTMR